MTPLVALLATNALLAVPLALVAWAAERGFRRPGIAHALWALALLKLLTPPLLPLPVIPAGAPPERATAADPADRVVAGPAEDTPAAALTSGMLAAVAAAGVAAGGALVLALAFVRGRRFLRLVGDARPAPPDDQARLAAIASRMGVGAPIAFELVAARVPPLLWAGARGPRLLLAAELHAQLSPAELEAVLAHELAHLRRRDHWMRAVELAVAALFWWYPLAWWVRRRLRAAEERCCDEWVLRALPGGARDYARALVKSAGFASAPAALPAGASGAVAARDLELRIRGILMSRPTRVLSRPWRLLLAGVAGIVLAALPTRAQDPRPPESEGAAPAAEPAAEGDSQEMDRRAAELEEQRRALEAHRRELEATRVEIEAARAALERERREVIEAQETERRALEAATAEAASEPRKPREAAEAKAARKAETKKEAARTKLARKAEAQREAGKAEAARKAAAAAEAAMAAEQGARAAAAAQAQAVREAVRASADAMREGARAHAEAIREAMKATTEAHARAVREAVRASSDAHAQALREAMRNLAAQLSELRRQDVLGPEVIERLKAEIARMREAVEGPEKD